MVQVKVREGVLEGELLENEFGGKIFSFKGIPYAQPPLGDLRFKAPQPLKPWDGVRSAKEHGPICYQYDGFLDLPPCGSEDCLYLNVYSPNIKPSKPLPVMFWIHGGGFTSGSGNSELYGPEFLLRHDVILVTINYRLEVLGFLSLDTEDIPGNAGMKDQVAALRWVKANISNFGGDPENITIFGESAGGASVTYHLVSPMTKGLFKRAIAQSGSANYWAKTFEPRERAKAIARQLGFESDSDKELYEFFKNQPVENLIKIRAPITMAEEVHNQHKVYLSVTNEKQFGNNERFFYGDIYDIARNNGIHEGVEVIEGYCADEGFLIVAMGKILDKILQQANAYPEIFAPMEFSTEVPIKDAIEAGRRIKEFYFGNKKPTMENIEKFIKIISMQMFDFSIVQWQKICSTKNKVYLYKFTCHSERNWFASVFKLDKFITRPTTSHADDIGYLFPFKGMKPMTIDENSETFKLINNVTTLWTNFAKYGNPTPDGSLGVEWAPYTVEDQKYLDIGNKLVPGSRPDDEEIQFWESIYREFLPHYIA